MCGIAGFSNIKNKNFSININNNQLYKLHDSISHRGPDDFGIWKSEKFEIALVHRRLSIVELSQLGHQPMWDSESSIVVIFNGEIYNHELIRAELINTGQQFKSRSDTETIIYAYKKWGINCLDKLEGMFAFCLFDLKKNELYLVRDRIGVKPLYFSLQNDILSFASEIKALLSLDFVEKSLNTQNIYHYLSYLVTPAPLTIYNNIYKLPAGYYLKLDAQKNISFVNWYDPLESSIKKYFNNNIVFQDEKTTEQELLKLLDISVQKRLMSDVPLGVFLSGGVDSSLLLALMSKHTDKLKSFNISFDVGLQYNEQIYAREVAKLFKAGHTEIVIGEKESFEFYSRMIHHHDEPLADCVSIPLYYISQNLRDSGAKVVLIGEGADELFFGYDMYARYLKANNFLSKFNLFPVQIKQLINLSCSKLFKNKYLFLDLIDNWSQDKPIFWSGAISFPESLKHKFFKEKNIFKNNNQDNIVSQIYYNINQDFDSYKYLNYHAENFNNLYKNINNKYNTQDQFATFILYLELKNRLPELLLMRADKITMAASIEGREPFLDHNLVEFALAMPVKFKFKNNITKYILKKLAEKFLPKEIIYRKKVGFAAPTKIWLQNGKYFNPYFKDLLSTKRNSINQYFDITFIELMLKEHESGRKNFADQLWTLQNLFSLDVF